MNWNDIFRAADSSPPQLIISPPPAGKEPSRTAEAATSQARREEYDALLKQQAREMEELYADYERMRQETLANPEYQALIKKYPAESAEFLAEPEDKVPAELIVFDALREYDQQQEEWRRWQKETLYWLAIGKPEQAN